MIKQIRIEDAVYKVHGLTWGQARSLEAELGQQGDRLAGVERAVGLGLAERLDIRELPAAHVGRLFGEIMALTYPGEQEEKN